MKTFTLKNPAKPPAYLRLYTAEGMAICQMKITNVSLEPNSLGVNSQSFVMQFDILDMHNVQTTPDSCLGEAQFESQPGRAIRAFSYTLAPQARKSLTLDTKYQKASPTAKQKWWQIWKR